jgi:phosphate transport system permease protein
MANGDIRVDTPSGSTPGDGSQQPRSPQRSPAPIAPDTYDPIDDHRVTVVGSAEPLAVSVNEKAPPVPGAGGIAPGTPKGKIRIGDRLFGSMAASASGIVILIVVMVAIFLLVRALPSIVHDKVNFLTSNQFDTTPGNLHFGVAGLLWTTVLMSVFALAIAVPIAIGIALFITQYSPPRVARPVAYTIDLLAAIPSIIYGIWGARVLAPKLTPVQHLFNHLGAIPIFKAGLPVGTVFDAGVVLTVMILPIITAISRDVFERTPTANKEAALAMGATRWEMIRMAVLPYGRAGVTSGAMLGLGRALGETIAVYLILSKVSHFSWSLGSGGETFATKIANNAAEFGSNPGPYIAAGLVLFVLTFIVNAGARAVVNRRKDFS